MPLIFAPNEYVGTNSLQQKKVHLFKKWFNLKMLETGISSNTRMNLMRS